MAQLAALTAAAQKAAAAQKKAQAKADAHLQDDHLAQAKGNSPPQIEARKRVARLFCEIHLTGENAAERDARLKTIDYKEPVTNINARGMDLGTPRKAGFFGLRRATTIWTSARIPPKKPDDPVYALEFYTVKAPKHPHTSPHGLPKGLPHGKPHGF